MQNKINLDRLFMIKQVPNYIIIQRLHAIKLRNEKQKRQIERVFLLTAVIFSVKLRMVHLKLTQTCFPFFSLNI